MSYPIFSSVSKASLVTFSSSVITSLLLNTFCMLHIHYKYALHTMSTLNYSNNLFFCILGILFNV
nr:MAG TPA: hypothetical protein [Caudoviricetes sp.]